MTYRTRIKYTAKQKSEIWDRWQRGESLNQLDGYSIGPPPPSLIIWRLVAEFVLCLGDDQGWLLRLPSEKRFPEGLPVNYHCAP
jgi:hypothetical protein